MKPEPTCAAVILSGGRNTRMGGRNKAFLSLGDRRFLDRIVDTVSPLFNEIIIATRHPDRYREFNLATAVDSFEIRSPLAGIHAGLNQMQSGYAFVTTCDAPLIRKQAIQLLVDAVVPGVDAVVPVSQRYYQPLFAVYSKKCRVLIENMLRAGQVKVDRLFEQIRLKQLDYERFRSVDPQLHSFFNINTPHDLDEARKLME